MRKLVLSALAVAALTSVASADNLVIFTFDTASFSGSGTTFGPITADAGVFQGTSNGRGNHAVAATAWSSPAGNGSAASFSSNNWSIGDNYEFRTSSAGYDTISVTWDQTSSNTGPRDFVLQLSVDGGANYSNVFSYMVLPNAAPNPVWSSGGSRSPLYTNTVSLGVAAANLADLRIRFADTSTTSANGGTVAAAGTDRIDNVQVVGTLVPTPGALALLGIAGLAGARRRR